MVFIRIIESLLFISYGTFLTIAYFEEYYNKGITAMYFGWEINLCLKPKPFLFLKIFSWTFFIHSCINRTIIFLNNVAQKWPGLMIKWTSTGKHFIQRPYQSYKLKLSVKIKLTAVIIIILVFIQYTLYLMNSTYIISKNISNRKIKFHFQIMIETWLRR